MFITKHTQRAGLLPLLAAAALPVLAQPVTPPSDGDIFLGFRASGGQGSGVSVLVNVGNDTTFRNAAPGTTLNLNGLGDIGTDLATTFGADWHERPDVFWGFFGARNNANPPVYASRAQNPVGAPAPDWTALATNARTATKNKIISVVTAYQGLEATGNSLVTGVQTNALNDGSYNFQITGGTTSFGTLSQWTNIQDSFGAGAAGTALDFFRLSGSTQKGDVVSRLGTFAITSDGSLSFTAAPLLNQVSFERIAYSVQEDAGNVVIAIERAGDISGTSSATFQIADGTAEAGTDFTLPVSFTVNFAADQALAEVAIPVLNRPGQFGSRSFTATLVSATGGFETRAPSATTVTITDIDPASTLNFAGTSVQVQQFSSGSTPNTAVLTVTRTGVTTGSVSIQVSATGGTLTAGTHFTFSSPQTLTFLTNETSKTINIPLTAGIIPGTIQFSLSNPTGSTTVGDAGIATVNVVPNAGDIAFSAATFNTSTASSSVDVTLTRTNGSSGAVSVEVSVTGGSLTNGTGYTFVSPAVVNFANGATTASVTVQLSTTTAGDIVLSLANPTGSASIGAQATATISVAGAPGTLAFGAASFFVVEEFGVANIPVVRTGGSSGAVTATVNTANGTAVAPGDYTALSNFLVTLPEGVTTFQVPVSIILDNVKNEPNETFTLTLSNPEGGAALGSITAATVTILDLDTAAPSVTVTTPKKNAKVPEAGGNQVTVSGSAKDNKGLATIEIEVNGGGYQETPFTVDSKGVAVFSSPVTAERGTNLVKVRATDHRGNVSKEVVLSFIYDDPFAALAGVYTGLSSASGGFDGAHQTEGLVTVTVGNTGAFSGKLTIDGLALPFSGVIGGGGVARFGAAGADKIRVERPNKPSFEIAFTLDLTKNAARNKITGTVVEYLRSAVVTTADIEADRAGFNGKSPATTVPAGYLANRGVYTVVFPAQAPQPGFTAADYPQGDGIGNITVRANGTIQLAAVLADSTKVTASGNLWKDLKWPLYAELYGKRGSLSGFVTLDDSQAGSDISGNDLAWFRPYQNVHHYPFGWPEGLTTVLLAAKYAVPAGASALPGPLLAQNPTLGNAILSFTDGLLPAQVNKAVNLDAKDKAVNAPNSDKSFSLAITQASGQFKGVFTHLDNTKPAFLGAIYQKGPLAGGYGFFLSATPRVRDGTGQSGSVTLSRRQ